MVVRTADRMDPNKADFLADVKGGEKKEAVTGAQKLVQKS